MHISFTYSLVQTAVSSTPDLTEEESKPVFVVVMEMTRRRWNVLN